MMTLFSKNTLVLAVLFLVPFVAAAQNVAITKASKGKYAKQNVTITEASKGKYANKIVVEWSGQTAVLYRLYSKVIVENVKTLDFKDKYPTEKGENKIIDRDVEDGYYYYKMGKSINYGHIAKVANNEPKIPNNTINKPVLKGEIQSRDNSKIVSLALDETTVNAVNELGGSIKIFRSDREQTMSLGKPTFTKSKSVEFETKPNGVFVDKNVNDTIHLYKYQIIVFDRVGNELIRSNVIEIDLNK